MKLGFVVIYVDDVKSCLQFYQAAFGLEIRMEYEDKGVLVYGELETGGAVLGFANHDMGKLNIGGPYLKTALANPPFGEAIVFVDDNVEAAYQKAIAAGATSIAPPEVKPWGQTICYIRATEGTLIEICSPMGE